MSGKDGACFNCETSRYTIEKGRDGQILWDQNNEPVIRKAHGETMDFFLPKGVRIIQLDPKFAPDEFGVVRLIHDEHKIRGKTLPLVKYDAVRTGLDVIRKQNFLGKTYYTSAQIEKLLINEEIAAASETLAKKKAPRSKRAAQANT